MAKVEKFVCPPSTHLTRKSSNAQYLDFSYYTKTSTSTSLLDPTMVDFD